MKPLYITDLDHTFLRSDLSISPFSIRIWNPMTAQALLSIATARSYKKSIEFLGKLHLEVPLILLDGALIVSEKKEIIDMKLLDKAIGDAVIAEGSKFGIYPFILSLADSQLNEHFIYPAQRNTFQSQLLERYRGDDNLIEHQHLHATEQNFKIVYMGDEVQLRALTQHLKEVFADALEFKLAPEAYLGCYFLTILHPQADKAHGLTKVSEYLSHRYSDVTVFGDNINDLGMFKLADTSVAVANALQSVKAAADIILPHTNDEDGVAHYLADQGERIL